MNVMLLKLAEIPANKLKVTMNAVGQVRDSLGVAGLHLAILHDEKPCPLLRERLQQAFKLFRL